MNVALRIWPVLESVVHVGSSRDCDDNVGDIVVGWRVCVVVVVVVVVGRVGRLRRDDGSFPIFAFLAFWVG